MSTAAAVRHHALLADVAILQCGVVSRGQLLALGITADHVRNQVAAHRWAAIGRRVVVLHAGPLSLDQQRWVAVLQQTPGAALAGISAAQADGLRWWAPEQLHVIVPYGSRVVRAEGVVVHASRTYAGELDQHPVRLPPRTRIERSVVDAATWAQADRRACGVLCAAVQQRLTTATHLLGSLESAGSVRRRNLIRLTLGDIEGGAQSFAEIDMGRLARRAGVIDPVRQSIRYDSGGRRRYLDNDFGWFNAEVDGALHLLPDTYWDDMHRQNERTLADERTLHFPTVAIRLDPERVMRQLWRAADRWGGLR